LEEVAAGIFAPAQAYFERTFFDEGSALAHQVAMARAAQYFNPVYAAQKPVTNEKIDALAIYVRLTPSIIRQMKAECKRYLELASCMRFALGDRPGRMVWKANEQKGISSTAVGFKSAVLIPFSSAAAERVGQTMVSVHDKSQQNRLEENLETTVICAYNHRDLSTVKPVKVGRELDAGAAIHAAIAGAAGAAARAVELVARFDEAAGESIAVSVQQDTVHPLPVAPGEWQGDALPSRSTPPPPPPPPLGTNQGTT
jgi:hypothetical protein